MPYRQQLNEMGVKPKDQLLSPKAVKFICDQLSIDIWQCRTARFWKVVPLQRQSEQTGLLISLNWRWHNISINILIFSIMSKSYKVSKKTMNMGPKMGKTVYSVRPYSYGTLTTKDIANQIAMESTATPADVMAVLPMRRRSLLQGTQRMAVRTPAVVWIPAVVRTPVAVQGLRTETTLMLQSKPYC